MIPVLIRITVYRAITRHMVFPTCGNDELSEALEPKNKRKRAYDPNELSDLELRAINLARQHEANQRFYKNAQAQRVQSEAQVKQMADELFWQRAARATNIMPHKLKALEKTFIGRITQALKKLPGGIEEFLVNGLNQNVASIGLPKGVAEGIRSTLIYNRRLAEGIVENVLKMRGLRKLREITDVVRTQAKALGVSKEEIDEVMALAVELSQLNARRAAYGVGSPADVLNMRKVDKLKDRILDMGFTPQQQEFIFDKAIELGNVLQEGRALALAFDINLGYVDNLGYFTRMMTPEARNWFDNVMDVSKFFGENNTKTSLNISTAFNKSRSTYQFIPQDIPLMAHKLGVESDEILDLLDDPKAMTKYLHDNLTSAELDDLVDVGLVAKIPMTMDEVAEYLLKQYGDDLPFHGMSDIFLTDPDQVAQIYADGIQRAVGESGMIRSIMKGGMDGGWGIPKMEFDQLAPELKREFRVIDPDTIKKYVPDYQGKDSMYVHRVVHDTWKSITDIAVDPAKHGAVAGFFNYLNGIFTRSLLATPQFVMRVAYSSTIALGAAGGNIFRLPEAFFDIQRITARGIDDALENTQKIYKIGADSFTEKELFEEFLYTLPKGYNPIMPGTKVSAMSGSELFKKLINIPGQMNYFWQYSNAFFGSHPKKVAQLWADALKKGNENLMSPLMSAGGAVEAATRWAAFKSLADTRAGSKVGSFVSGLGVIPKQFNSVQDLATHINDYFFAFDDVGYVTSFMSRYVRPFAIFAMNNPPAVMRHIIRNPHAFINYWRLRSLLNGQASQDKDVQDSTVPDYVQRSGPIFMFKDGDKWATLLTNNFDQISDASSYIFKELPEEIQYQFGWSVGNTEKQRSRLQEKLDSKRWFQRNAQELLPIYRNAAELLTGIDSATGRPIDLGEGEERESFLFWQPDPKIRWILSSYSPLEWLDRINPGDVFGTPTSFDTKTGKPIPGYEGKRGMFNSIRTQRQIDKYDPLGQTMLIKLMRLGGFQVRIIDTAREHQRTWTDINETQALLRKEMNSANRMIKDNPNLTDEQKLELYLTLSDRRLSKEEKERRVLAQHPSNSVDYVRRSQVAVDLLETWIQLEFDRRRVEQYMLEKSIPPKEISKQLRDINIEDIPPIEDIAGEEILKEVAKSMGLKANGNQ